MMTILRPVLVSVCLAVLPGGAHGADTAAGLAKAKEICQACHGLDGNSPTPDYPKLAGQNPDYLARRCAITSRARARIRSWAGWRAR